MARSKADGRLTKQNAVAFKKDVENRLVGMQARLDQMEAHELVQTDKIQDLESRVQQLADANLFRGKIVEAPVQTVVNQMMDDGELLGFEQ